LGIALVDQIDVVVISCIVELFSIRLVVLIQLIFELVLGLTGTWVVMPDCVWFVPGWTCVIMVTIFSVLVPIPEKDMVWLGIGT
jgi:hypothetical protein